MLYGPLPHMGDAAMGDSGETALYIKILSLAREGATKKQVADALSISYTQLRRHTSALVDMRLLHYDEKRRVLITTEKGHIFLKQSTS